MRQICPCKICLENGADLVLELPVVFSLSGAESFAKAGVAIASAFDCTNYLAFGSESGDCELLKKSANAVCDERVQALVRDGMKNGGYYPRELENASKRFSVMRFRPYFVNRTIFLALSI